MNKHCHKVIFSKTQQRFVVVSELAKSEGKSSADCRKHSAEDFFGLVFDKVFRSSAIPQNVLYRVNAEPNSRVLIAGAGGEAAAMAITSTLYPDKKPNELTEAEKQNVVFLSQLASGLASGVVGDSSLEATTGAEIGKLAVENNYLTEQESETFINEYSSAQSLQEKVNVLVKYLKRSKTNDQDFKVICDTDPVSCIKLIESAQKGTGNLVKNQNIFGLSPYFTAILNSNYRADSNNNWTSSHITDLYPRKLDITPNQPKANELADYITKGKIKATKRSLDILYTLNTDPELTVKINPNYTYVVQTGLNWLPANNGGKKVPVLAIDPTSFSILGQLTLRARPETNEYRLYSDIYDFTLQNRNTFLGRVRDFETIQGTPSKTGTPFNIDFQDARPNTVITIPFTKEMK